MQHLPREGQIQRRPSGPDVSAAGFSPSSRTSPPLRPPPRRTAPGRADPGKPPPASWQRPARPPARRKNAPPCSLPPEGSHRQGSPPASRKNASPVAASCWKRPSGRPPARRTNTPPPCSLQPKGANAQTPIRLRPRASLNRLHGRAASSGVASSVKPPSRLKRRMDSTAPSGWNAIRYGNGVERTNRVRANRLPSLGPPTRAHRQGRVADHTLRSSGTDEPRSLRA